MQIAKSFLILSLAVASSAAWAGPLPLSPKNRPTLEAVMRALRSDGVVRRKFQQTKRIAALRHPLRSSGTLLFSRKQGIIWTVRKPFPTTYVITQNSIVRRVPGEKPIRITAAQKPLIFQYTNVFMTIFKGDTGALERAFTVRFGGSLRSWNISLVPRDSNMRRAVSQVLLHGSRGNLKWIRMREARGDGTTIRFVGASAARRTSLTSAERALFAR